MPKKTILNTLTPIEEVAYRPFYYTLELHIYPKRNEDRKRSDRPNGFFQRRGSDHSPPGVPGLLLRNFANRAVATTAMQRPYVARPY